MGGIGSVIKNSEILESKISASNDELSKVVGFNEVFEFLKKYDTIANINQKLMDLNRESDLILKETALKNNKQIPELISTNKQIIAAYQNNRNIKENFEKYISELVESNLVKHSNNINEKEKPTTL